MYVLKLFNTLLSSHRTQQNKMEYFSDIYILLTCLTNLQEKYAEFQINLMKAQ